MSEYILGLYEKSMPGFLTLEEKLSTAGECGFDYMELSIDETDEKLGRLKWTTEQRNALRNSIEKTGVPVYSICLSGHRKYPLGHPDPGVQKRSLEIMADAVNLAADIGIRIIQIAGYDVYYEDSTEESREIFGKNLSASVEIAARKGVTLAFETMETELINTVEKAAAWVKQIDSPYLQIYPDIGNITNAAVSYGTDFAEDLKTGRGHISAVHLKETVPGVFREMPFGTGHVDFDRACEVSLALGSRMFVGEFWYTGEENWKEIICSNNVFLRTAIENGWKRYRKNK